MRKAFITVAAVIGAAVTGLLVWRKVESDRIRDDLWAQAATAAAPQETPTPKQEPVPAPVQVQRS